jgi:hypothetical protein
MMRGRVLDAYRGFLEHYRITASHFWFIAFCFAGIIVILIFIPWNR